MAQTFNSFKDLGTAFASDFGKREYYQKESDRRKKAVAAKAAKMACKKAKKARKAVKPVISAKPVKPVMQVVTPASIVPKLEYEILQTVKAVKFFVPSSEHSNMVFFENKGDKIPAHWRFGKQCGPWINHAMHGLKDSDLGKYRVFNVQVLRKHLANGKSYIMLNLEIQPKASAKERMFFADIKDSGERGIRIPGSKKELVFQPLFF